MTRFLTTFILTLCFLAIGSNLFAQEASYNTDDFPFVIPEKILGQRPDWGEGLNDAGSWCPSGTLPNLPEATYFQEAVWLGDTLYVHTPTSTGAISTTIRKYTVGGSWTIGVPLPASLAGGAMVTANGKLYFLGGGATSVTTGPVNTVYEYNPATGAWTTMAPMPAALSGHGAVVWGDSVIFVVGGPWTNSNTNLAVHYYRLATNTWGTIANSLPAGQGRRSFGLGISGNKIIVSAGFHTAFLKNTWIGTIGSDASQLTWAAGPDVPTIYTGLSRPGGAAIGKYFFLVNGERATAGGYYDTTHVFDVELGQWIDIINNKPVKMSNIWNAVAPRLHGDTIKVYVPGGYGSLTGATPGAAFADFDVIGCGNLLLIPVELSSFTASISNNIVTLKWQTASENNNQGFEIQRRADAGYSKIGYVQGAGTTTDIQNYSFVDMNLKPGIYHYRLKQIDFDGTIAYSNEINVEVSVPNIFVLNQNYPNPFNPTTSISFSLPVDANVSLKIFNALGQEVTRIIEGNLVSGFHEINFDAAGLTTGVYFYNFEATGVDGRNFTSVRKMILTK